MTLYLQNESDQTIQHLHKLFNESYEGVFVCLDTETTGLDVLKLRPLLMSLNSNYGTIVLNLAKLSKDFIKSIFNQYGLNKTYLAHNAKYDGNVMYHHYGLDLDWYCTMVSDQKLSQGLGYSEKDRPDGVRYNLSDTAQRHLKVPALNKEQQLSFVDYLGSEFSDAQIEYAGKDVDYLYPIMKNQLLCAAQFGIKNLLTESEILSEVCIAECTGVLIDRTKWINIAEQVYAEIQNIAKELDQIVKTNKVLIKKRGFIPLSGNYDLFTETDWVREFYQNKSSKAKLTALFNQGVNWASPTQVTFICGQLNYHLPVKDEDIYLVPDIKVTNNKRKVISSIKYTTKKDKLEVMLQNFEHPNKEFIELIFKYNSLRTLFATYGGKWLNKLHNHRIYTAFRTMSAVTGRFQSGGGTKLPDKINTQNIPSAGDYRHCFVADKGHSLITADLSGAEVIILADKANEQSVYDRAVIDDDSHSPVAQYTWQQIYLFRAGKEMGLWYDVAKFRQEKDNPAVKGYFSQYGTIEAKECFRLSQELIVSKKENKHIRNKFKSSTFGGIYGMEFRKCAETLGIDWEEAKVALQSMKDCMPKCYEYVESEVKLAAKQGYSILNKYGGSRITFPLTQALVHQNKNAYDSIDAIKEVKAVRNYPMQGTQADMIKLAIANIRKLRKIGLEVTLLLQVHDELVYQTPEQFDGVSEAWINNKANAFEFTIKYEREVSFDSALKFCEKYSDHVVSIKTTGLSINYKISNALTIPIIMLYSADLYLERFTMGSSLEVQKYWQK